MRKRDLFYYIFDTNNEKYNEIYNLILSVEDKIEYDITDEQLLFMRDFILRLLFRIAILEYKGYKTINISKMMSIDDKICILNVEQIKDLKNKYKKAIEIIKEYIGKIYNNVTIGIN